MEGGQWWGKGWLNGATPLDVMLINIMIIVYLQPCFSSLADLQTFISQSSQRSREVSREGEACFTSFGGVGIGWEWRNQKDLNHLLEPILSSPAKRGVGNALV